MAVNVGRVPRHQALPALMKERAAADCEHFVESAPRGAQVHERKVYDIQGAVTTPDKTWRFAMLRQDPV